VRKLRVGVNERSKSYKAQRDIDGRTARVTLGTTDNLSLDGLKTRAMEAIWELRQGIHPNGKRAPVAAKGWRMAEAFEQYAADLRARECTPSTIANARRLLDYHWMHGFYSSTAYRASTGSTSMRPPCSIGCPRHRSG
jgi:hypothetical protein